MKDYYQTTERYRRQEFRAQVNWFVRICLLGIMLWIGWFWGNSQQLALMSSNAQQIMALQQENENLQQQITTLNTKFEEEQRLRLEAELVNGVAGQDDRMKRLSRRIARHLARGVDEKQILRSLNGLSKPTRCRTAETKDVAVATSLFAGGESKVDLLSGALQVFIEGEAGHEATRDTPWFDPEKPVSMRISYFGGEKINSGSLPLETVLIADTWLIKIKLFETNLQGYVNLILETCPIDQ